jgi:hypothetical protein
LSELEQKSAFAEALKKSFSKIGDLPEWMQIILLEDINATIENRVRTMEMILCGKTEQ